jgi:serine/threonine-protein kinase RsbT
MQIRKTETLPVRSSAEVVGVRQAVRKWAIELGFSLVEQTKVVTAASELARNMIDYGGGGAMRLEALDDGFRRGLRLHFEDQGPGIPDLDAALRDGFTTGSGMGLGLGGAKRLSNEFDVKTAPGEGTHITITRWKGVS